MLKFNLRSLTVTFSCTKNTIRNDLESYRGFKLANEPKISESSEFNAALDNNFLRILNWVTYHDY